MPQENTELSATKKALIALKQMQAKLEAMENAKHEPIAIIGIACSFPGESDTPQAFWQNLKQGKDAITPVPQHHWNRDQYPQIANPYGGFIPNLKEFDAQFFAISPREALSLDPQQRLLLETSWEALENAAIAPQQLSQSATGVFIGICASDYWHRLLNRNPTEIDAYLTTGNTHSMASGRLSYFYGLNGPSISLDTACSSSLVAVHLACQSLRNNECNLAIVGGVNRLIAPEISINFSKARMLSAKGRCQSFDASADGFVRSEGCGVVILKRLSEAITAGDNILALISGSAVNQDGASNGLTVPNGIAQQKVIHQALANSRLEASQISYIETHGTGTYLGDPVEAEALNQVYGNNRPTNKPLLIGSVKTNIGHLEAAAGIASLIKVILALQHQQIPQNLHFHQPNPQICWDHLKVPTTLTPWENHQNPRIAGISSFGFSGTNAHLILTEHQHPQTITSQPESPHLFTLSAKTETALQQLATHYAEYLRKHPTLNIGDLCFTLSVGRSHFHHRLALITSSTSNLQQNLTLFVNRQPAESLSQAVIKNLKSSDPQTPDPNLSLEEIKQLYLKGTPLDWASFYRQKNQPYRKLVLPNYPFQRQTFWL